MRKISLILIMALLLLISAPAYAQPGPPPPPPPGPPGPPPPPPDLPPGPPPPPPPDLPPGPPPPPPPPPPTPTPAPTPAYTPPVSNGSLGYGPPAGLWSNQISNIPDNQVWEVKKKGLSDKQPDVPPFGLDANGNPNWPVSSSTLGFTASAGTNIPKQNVAEGTGEPPSSVIELWHQGTAKNVKPGEWKPVSEDKPRSPSSPAPTTKSASTNDTIPTAMIKEMKAIFIVDSERHAKYVFENKWIPALAVSNKWESFGRMFSSNIEQITGGVGPMNGFPNFQSFIRSVVEHDWAEAKRQGLH
ncbi:MAG: hypothetical protein HQM09_08660 [Candidatus Riflebacteria bacterium]|nr:hypothetical protein [Candidatus Riflebacteria bacterium]